VDSLRAIAALSVLTFHAVGYWAAGFGSHSFLRPYLARLDVGVVVFLVVSGFLLYRPFVQAAAHGAPAPDTAGYLWRRLLRIGPAYWVALLICAIALSLPGVLTARGVPTYFGFGQIYGSSTIGGGIAPAWTLGLEVSFYLLLPFYARLMRRTRAEPWGVIALFASSMAYKAVLFATGVVGHPSLAPHPALVVLPAYLDEFALGMALALISVRRHAGWAPRPLVLLERRPWIAWLAAGAAFVIVARGIGLTGDPGQTYDAGQYLARNALYGLVAVGLLAPAVFGADRVHGVRRVLAVPALAWLGTISFGIYLWHWPVLMQLSRWGLGTWTPVQPYLRWGISALVLSVALGALSYYLIERPALSLKRLVGGRAPVAAQAAP
jgi:peptidoglycan/LPS O-acetylase OafA/YrhL